MTVQEVTLLDTLADRLRGEFVRDSYSPAQLLSRVTGSEYPAAAVFISGGAVTVQAIDVRFGGCLWQAEFSVDAPLELILVTARSAAEGDL